MSNDIFSQLRKRMTLNYALIFGLIVTIIVLAAYALTWWSLLSIEKQEMYNKVVHEGEEWVASREAPVNEKELAQSEVLAYFEAPDGKAVILDQMGNTVGKLILENRRKWPALTRKTKLVRFQDKDGNHYRYLAGVAVVKAGEKTVGTLYMFKNFQAYYSAAERTLISLGALLVFLFMLGSLGSYYLAGRNIKPIQDMYEKQKQFTADASHEMRTPLAVLKLSEEGIRSDEENTLSKFSSETLQMMEEEINRLTALTENLMTLARSDTGENCHNLAEFDFSSQAEKVVGEMQILAKAQNKTFGGSFQPKLYVYGNQDKLRRLLIILLDNAMKYSPRDTKVEVSLEKSKTQLLLKVKDQGEGISNEDKLKVFDRFYRVDKARSRSMGGLGLGLSLAKAIVAEHNGKIWITDNEAGQGTVFNVSLPLRDKS